MLRLSITPRFGFPLIVCLAALMSIIGQVSAEAIQRDELVTSWLQRVVTPSNLCSEQALSALAISQDQCVSRIQRVHKECPAQLASSFPDHLSPAQVSALYTQVSACYSQVMSGNYH